MHTWLPDLLFFISGTFFGMGIEHHLLAPYRTKKNRNKSDNTCPNPSPMLEVKINNSMDDLSRPVILSE